MKSFFGFLMVLILLYSIALPSLAISVQEESADEYTVVDEDGFEKQVNVVGDVKLFSWENESTMTFEQYGADDKLIDQVVVDKQKNAARIDFDETFFLESPHAAGNQASRAIEPRYNIDRVKVINPFTSPTTQKNMLVFEDYTAQTRAYNVPTTAKTLAQLASQIAMGLACTAGIAGKLASTLLSVGICKAIDYGIVWFFKVTVLAEKRTMTYYGKDVATSAASKQYQSGVIWKVSDRESKYFNNEYTEGLVYSKDKFNIAEALCVNLYGPNFQCVF